MARLGLDIWDPWREMDRFLSGFGKTVSESYPPLNLFFNDNEVVVTSEIPGVDPEKIDLSVTGDVLIIEGVRPATELKEGEKWHRKERGYGRIYRKIHLPYNVEGSKVDAKYEKGVLTITLPRAESGKPRKISVKAN